MVLREHCSSLLQLRKEACWCCNEQPFVNNSQSQSVFQVLASTGTDCGYSTRPQSVGGPSVDEPFTTADTIDLRFQHDRYAASDDKIALS